MMRTTSGFVCLVTFLFSALSGLEFVNPARVEAAISLVPAPRSLRMTGGEAVVTTDWHVVVTAGEDSFAASLLVHEISQRYGFRIPIASNEHSQRVIRFVHAS